MHSEEIIERIPRLSRIWADAKDVYVCHYIIYVDENGLAYIDPEFEFPIDAETFKDVFLKTLLLSDGGVFYTPAAMSENEGIVSVSYAKVSEGAIVPATAQSHTSAPIPIELPPELTSLSLGTETLVPEFSSAVTEYAVTTSETDGLLSFVASPIDATVEVTLNAVPVIVEDLDEPLVFTAGPDIIAITVTEGLVDKTYTITVTQDA